MALPTDLSLMDFLFEREDPLLGLSDKDINGKPDYSENNEITVENWATNADDLLDSMLKFEDSSFDILNDNILPELNVANSSCSDSGLSSDQQMSPRLIEPDEDDIHIFNCEENINSVQNEVEIDSSVLNDVEDENLNLEDDQAVINVLSLPEQNEMATVISSQNINVSPSTTVLRVTPVSGNPRSLLLPVNLKNVRDIKTIKVINLSRTGKGDREITKVTVKKESSAEDGNGVKSQYPRLQLTSEEKRLLQKEGVRLPTHYPLTKNEERELKRIRRKIRNKISAQDSRKRKKEYIDGLEERVKQCTEENLQLVKRIKVLQTQNQSLSAQLRRLQALLSRTTAKSVQPATCLMVLLLSMALIMAPNLRPGSGSKPDISDLTEMGEQTEQDHTSTSVSGRSRNLLFSDASTADEICTVEKECVENVRHALLDDHDYGPPPPKYARFADQNMHAMPSSIMLSESPGSGNLFGEPEDDFIHELRVNMSEKGGPHSVTLQVPAEK